MDKLDRLIEASDRVAHGMDEDAAADHYGLEVDELLDHLDNMADFDGGEDFYADI